MGDVSYVKDSGLTWFVHEETLLLLGIRVSCMVHSITIITMKIMIIIVILIVIIIVTMIVIIIVTMIVIVITITITIMIMITIIIRGLHS